MTHLAERIVGLVMNREMAMQNIGHKIQGIKCRIEGLGIIAFLCLVISLFLLIENADAQIKMPDVCYKCHAQLKENLKHKYIHFPFRQGKCDSCHNLHVSDHKGLIKGSINNVCIGCHDGIGNLMKKGKVHGAIKNGLCTDCHNSHSSDNKNLLVKTEDKICWGCHENLKDELKMPYAHVPFNKGECSSCHNPHASVEDNMFITAPNKVCKSCHAPRCKVGGVSITHATKDMDCVSCHSGHNSERKGLLGPYGHSLFLEKSCESCHNPFAPDKKITTIQKNENLCFMCHPKEGVEFRNGDIHGTFKENPCTLCHVYHASKQRRMTVDDSTLCVTCHDSIEKKTAFMIKKIRNVKKTLIKDKKCFECHKPMHSNQPYYLKGDMSTTCARCHEAQHKIAHPFGKGVIDPRNGQDMHCMSCHSMHTAGAEFMLTHDRKRSLCIQCHKY